MAKVRANEAGYDNVVVRQPGEEFDWPEGSPVPEWADALDDNGNVIPRKASKKAPAASALA